MCGKLDQPLGLPAGSIRGIITLILVPLLNISAIVLMFFFFFREQYPSALGILSGLTGINGSIVGYYFGSKAADKSTKEIVEANNRVIEANRDIINVHRMINEEQKNTNEAQRNIIENLNRNMV
jgi:hypothetical protein